jgi:hypothetical protein
MLRVPLKLVVLVAALISGSGQADEFSWELAGLVSESETEPVFETDGSALQATHFFDPVDDANGPYALASFLDPASRVSVTLSHEKLTLRELDPFITPQSYVTKTDDYAVSGRYVLPRSKWYFGGGYATSDVEGGAIGALETTDADAYGALIGKYLGPATALDITFDSFDREAETPPPGPCPFVCAVPALQLMLEEQRDRVSVNVLHVRRFRSMTYSLSGRAAESSGELVLRLRPVDFPAQPRIFIEESIPRLRSYSVGGEIFPTAKLGVRLGYTRWDDDTPADDAYDVAATWFFRRDIGLQFVFSRQTADADAGVIFTDGEFEHADTATIRVVGRF